MRQSPIISSATSLESVSFQYPDRSVTESVGIRWTYFLGAHPRTSPRQHSASTSPTFGVCLIFGTSSIRVSSSPARAEAPRNARTVFPCEPAAGVFQKTTASARLL